jgi:hypothetical protein
MEEKMGLTVFQERIFKRNLDVIKSLEQGLTAQEVAKSFNIVSYQLKNAFKQKIISLKTCNLRYKIDRKST